MPDHAHSDTSSSIFPLNFRQAGRQACDRDLYDRQIQVFVVAFENGSLECRGAVAKFQIDGSNSAQVAILVLLSHRMTSGDEIGALLVLPYEESRCGFLSALCRAVDA